MGATAAAGMLRPPRLRPGSRVALVAPAGPVAEERIEVALARCRRLELEPVLGSWARGRYRDYLAGSDEQRLADLSTALADPDVDGVWALRGGYGMTRLLARLALAGMRQRPKPFIGFSDNTALHLALHAQAVVSYHGPHAGGDASALSERCLRAVLWRAEPAGELELPAGRPPVTLVPGLAEGPLVGGNLALLAASSGTPAALRAAGAVLFVEDVGEPAYRLDRSWTQLLLAGALDGVAGVAFGRFTDCEGDVPDLLRSLVEPLGVPAVAELPIGHEPDSWTLPLGVRARLDAERGTVALLEAAVS
jgi:muramoyltetrapeptide carboxypeptidase